MDRWLQPALDYVGRWLEFQMRASRQPGCLVAVVRDGKVVFERGYGHADVLRETRMTPRHRFRVASHSKSFTAAGIMKLHEQRKLRLDEPVGTYVGGLHRKVAQATISQLLSHTGGMVRDGPDSGQFVDRRSFPTAAELRADLQARPVIEANTRFKYSNHGYGLLGLTMEAVTGEPYLKWIKREIVDAADLRDTVPDMPLPRGAPLAQGHSSELPLDRRVVIPGTYRTHAWAPAAGFVTTAADLARFFNQLSPNARTSVISVASRREMTRPQWHDPHSSIERYYGLGVMSGTLDGWEWFGHSGGLQGYVSRTSTLPQQGLTISVLTNAIDGWAQLWLEGVVHILQVFAQNGAPPRRLADWSGRWWDLWGAVDLVPTGNKVLVAHPEMERPFTDASELNVTGRDAGLIAVAGGHESHGEKVQRVRGPGGKVRALWLGGAELRSERSVAREMERRYGGSKRGGAPSRRSARRPRAGGTGG